MKQVFACQLGERQKRYGESSPSTRPTRQCPNVVLSEGSPSAGKILTRQCADQIMKLGLDLGGNAPFIVFDDADLHAAMEGAMASKCRNNGQSCVCAKRFYTQAGVYQGFACMLADKVGAIEVGGGSNRVSVLAH